jgi:hypothetical protein
MKYFLLVFLLTATFIVGTGCEQAKSVQGPQAGDEPVTEVAEEEEAPLLLDDEPLLLLDDEPQTDQSTWSETDNSRCFVCHVNYMQEDIAVIHARADIGCASCHGKSDEHIADESWASGGNGTAPETMFPKPNINPFCMGCHTKDKIDTDQHKPLFANFEKMVCTDEIRKCKWK